MIRRNVVVKWLDVLESHRPRNLGDRRRSSRQECSRLVDPAPNQEPMWGRPVLRLKRRAKW